MIKNCDEKNWTLAFCFLSIFITTLSISSHSLWIDEGITTWFAFQDTFKDVIHTLNRTKMAESLMPGYVIYMWAWVKAFGTSEYILRFSNLPFIVLVLFLFTKIPMNRVFRHSVILLTGLSPFLCYYLNEARSYIALFSFSASGLTGLLFYFYGDSTLKKIGPHLTVISLLIGSFFNISIGFTVAALVPTAFLIQQEMKDNKNNFLLDWKKPALFSVPFFLVLGGYYLKVILAGSGGRLQGGYGILTYKHVLFCLYEFLGFSGIGPPRNIIRENPSISTFSPYLPWLGVAVLIMIGALVYIMILYKKDSADKLFFMNPYMWGLIFGFLSFGIFAFNFKITFYGRHVIFLYPYFIFAIALIAKEAWSTKSRLKLRYVLVASLLLIWLVSDFRLRFHPGYFKDDYRSAVSTALSLAADSAPIFWAADLHAGAYYGLEYYNSDFKVPPKIKPIRKVYDASGWPAEKVKASVKPFSSGVLVISKKDTFDTKNGWSWYISQHKVKEQIKFNAFTIYRYNF